jgi:hypothetical protein
MNNWSDYVQETIRLVLPKGVDTSDFANGSGYIQLTAGTHAKFMLRYREVIKQTAPEWLGRFDANPVGWIGRWLDDTGNPAYSLWGRAVCIDSNFRMWGQLYYATHQNEAKDVCLAIV